MKKTSKTPKTPKTPKAQVAGRLVVLAVLGVLGAAAMSMHQQLFLLCVRHAPPAPALPYDAEVEYLESTGTQYINTGIYVREGLIIACRFRFDISSSYDGGLPFFFRKSRVSTFGIFRYYEYLYVRVGSKYVQDVPFDTEWHDFVLTTSGQPAISLDGQTIVTSSSNYGTDNTFRLLIFCRQDSDENPSIYAKGKISNFTVTNATTGEKIQDLIAVRKDGVGYMYDRVSGTLLGNQGTGAFVIGPDK